jgi:hypothetical protein
MRPASRVQPGAHRETVERGENDRIGSRSIICQLLHKPEAAFQPDDVETVFVT